MENVWLWIVRAFGAAFAFVAGLLGGWDATLKVLCGAMAADFVTGLLVAKHGKSDKTESGLLSSGAAFLGLTKKAVMLILVGFSAAADRALDAPGVLRTAVSMFYIANEGLSLLENAALLGLPLPKALKAALEAMQDKAEKPPDEAG